VSHVYNAPNGTNSGGPLRGPLTDRGLFQARNGSPVLVSKVVIENSINIEAASPKSLTVGLSKSMSQNVCHLSR
jgi:hypothetical protein